MSALTFVIVVEPFIAPTENEKEWALKYYARTIQQILKKRFRVFEIYKYNEVTECPSQNQK